MSRPRTYRALGLLLNGLETGFGMAWDSACTCVKYRERGHRIES